MQVCHFTPADYAAEYRSQGYLRIRGGISDDFLAYLRTFVAELAKHRLAELAGKGNKEQALLEFPDDVDYPGELCDVVAEAAGLNRSTMLLSERHIKSYEADAKPNPTAHKDRYPSQVSVGLSISIPEASTLLLYTKDHVAPNPFNSAAELHASLLPDERPDVALADAEAVELDDADGDVLIFPGSATSHLRRNGATAIKLYLKFNDFGSDPLGEDPTTPVAARRHRLRPRRGFRPRCPVPIRARRPDTWSTSTPAGGGASAGGMYAETRSASRGAGSTLSGRSTGGPHSAS